MRESGDYSGIKAVERNLSFNVSGHVNHSIFWGNMGPDGGGEPGGELADKIEEDFGSFDNFKDQFTAAASGVEGSGWGMLVYENVADQLMTAQAEKHNNLALQGARPILVLDTWEHAFYLQYENDSSEYIDNWWNVVDWDNVAEQYDRAQEGHAP
jgi:Fe-Mn family superoxide dismutase